MYGYFFINLYWVNNWFMSSYKNFFVSMFGKVVLIFILNNIKLMFFILLIYVFCRNRFKIIIIDVDN